MLPAIAQHRGPRDPEKNEDRAAYEIEYGVTASMGPLGETAPPLPENAGEPLNKVMGTHERYFQLLHCMKIISNASQTHGPMPEPSVLQPIELDSDTDTGPIGTATGASKWPSGTQAQNPVSKQAKQAPFFLQDQTFASGEEVLGAGTTTFDVNVLVKVAEAGKRAGSKRVVPPVIQKLPVFFMNASTSFDLLLEHIAGELKTSVAHLPMHTCEWKKWQSTNNSLLLKDQGCYDALKCSYK
jgi:hypothetical protein